MVKETVRRVHSFHKEWSTWNERLWNTLWVHTSFWHSYTVPSPSLQQCHVCPLLTDTQTRSDLSRLTVLNPNPFSFSRSVLYTSRALFKGRTICCVWNMDDKGDHFKTPSPPSHLIHFPLSSFSCRFWLPPSGSRLPTLCGFISVFTSIHLYSISYKTWTWHVIPFNVKHDSGKFYGLKNANVLHDF